MVYHCYQCHLPVEQYMIRQQRDSYMKHYDMIRDVTVINNMLYSRFKMSTESLAQQVVAMVTTMTRMRNILTYLYGNKTILGKYE